MGFPHEMRVPVAANEGRRTFCRSMLESTQGARPFRGT